MWWHYNKCVNSLRLQVQSDASREILPTRVTRDLYRTIGEQRWSFFQPHLATCKFGIIFKFVYLLQPTYIFPIKGHFSPRGKLDHACIYRYLFVFPLNFLGELRWEFMKIQKGMKDLVNALNPQTENVTMVDPIVSVYCCCYYCRHTTIFQCKLK
jgi:hypothetical protein